MLADMAGLQATEDADAVLREAAEAAVGLVIPVGELAALGQVSV